MRGRTLLLAAALAAAAAPASAATRALLIGIDAYRSAPTLAGATNDVRDVAAVLARRGVATRTLLDGAATRAAVIAAFRDLVAEGAPGDLLYLHFSGHGISIPDRDGDETDGRDESYLLQGFDEAEHPDEQLVDDDLDALFRIAEAKGQQVLFVADACHSGSPSRAVGAGALPTRLYRPKTDPTRPPPIPAPTRADGEAAGVLAVGATLDDQVVPELMIDGAPRGALSYATARALDGAADLDGDGTVSAGEFELYVRQTVRNLAASKQTPQFAFSDATRRIVAVAKDGSRKPMEAAAAPAAAPAALPPIAVHVLPGAETAAVTAMLAGEGGVTLVDAPERAALLLDPDAGMALNAVRDVVASGARPLRDFPLVVEAARALDGIARLALEGPLAVEFSPDDRVQPQGTEIVFRVRDPALPYLTVFDLTATGSVHMLWPLGPADADPWPTDRSFRLAGAVTPPFGADTLVVVATAEKPETLRAALAGAGAGVRPATVFAALTRDVAGRPHRIGIQAFFTAEKRS